MDYSETNNTEIDIYIVSIGMCKAYKWKLVDGGICVWLYCRDGKTKMPESVFISHENYEVKDV